MLRSARSTGVSSRPGGGCSAVTPATLLAARFDQVSEFEKKVYLVALLCSAVASALLIAPSAYHRLNFARGDKPHIVEVASRMAVAGFAVLALAMAAAVLLVLSFVFGTTVAVVGTSSVALLIALLWFAVPLARRRSRSA